METGAESAPLTDGKWYYFTVSATNRAGLTAFLTSEPYYHDTATPTSGLVVDFDPSAGVEVVSGSSYHLSDIDVLLEGNSLGVRWEGFSHPTADVAYWVSLGTSPGSQDAAPLTSVGSRVSSYVFGGVALQEGRTYYATVIADTGFSRNNASSNGVLVLREGVAALSQAMVYDGRGQADLAYQTSLTEVSARWAFPAHLHASLSHYQWAVLRAATPTTTEGEEVESGSGIRPQLSSGSGTSTSGSGVDLVTEQPNVIIDYQNVGKDVMGVVSVPQRLQADGSVYMNAVRACFATRCLPPVLSNGFQLSLPPRPPAIVTATYTPLQLDTPTGSSRYGTLQLRGEEEGEEFRDPQLSHYEWALVGGAEGAGLLFGWSRAEPSENSVTIMLNATLSLHHENFLVLREFNVGGLYASVNTTLYWVIGGVPRPQADVPRPPLLVYDTDGSGRGRDPTVDGWREGDSRLSDIDYTGSESTLSGAWPDLRYTQYNYSVSAEHRYVSCDAEVASACGSTSLNSVTLSNLPLVDGERYYVCIRARREHAIHATPTTPALLEACSNGVTVDLTPPLGRCIGVTNAPSSRMDCASMSDTAFRVSTSEVYGSQARYTSGFHLRSVPGLGAVCRCRGVWQVSTHLWSDGLQLRNR